MRRLVIDARLAGQSGIGTYLEQILPRVTRALVEWRPIVLARSSPQDGIVSALPIEAEVHAWDVPPLSLRCLASLPPRATEEDLLWVPHFNVPLRTSMSLAVTLHDLLPLTAPALAGNGRAIPLRWWVRAIRQRARAIMCISSFTRDEAVKHGACTVERAVVTHLGVSPVWADASPPEQPMQPGPPTIIFTGLLKPHKNVARLLRALERVSQAIPHRLVLVAQHTRLRNVDQEARRLVERLAGRVVLVEDLPQPELVALVKAAEFAVIPSLHEGFGLPALEAMAAGVPLLASRAGALPEVCGDAALYCDPLSEEDIANGLLRLAGDSSLRRRLAIAGRQRAATFTWDHCAELTSAELDRALREPLQSAT